MAELFGLIECTLCSRGFKKYHSRENSQIYGVSLEDNKGNIKIVDNNKSEIDKHICTYCINSILNQFEL